MLPLTSRYPRRPMLLDQKVITNQVELLAAYGSTVAVALRRQAIADAARQLVRLRDEWLSGKGTPDLPLNQRTLTNLYNKRPDWLDEAHKRLDAAVFDAYE